MTEETMGSTPAVKMSASMQGNAIILRALATYNEKIYTTWESLATNYQKSVSCLLPSKENTLMLEVVAAPARVAAFGPNEYENTLTALRDKVYSFVFSKWGAGFGGLTVGAAACFGITAAAWTGVVGLAILAFCSYTSWRFDQIPNFWQLTDAAKQGRASKVQTLLTYWDTFDMVGDCNGIGSLRLAFDAAKTAGHWNIARQILTKAKEMAATSAQQNSIRWPFEEAVRSNDLQTVQLFKEVYVRLPAIWLVQALHDSLDPTHSAILDIILENIGDLPPRDVCLAASTANNEQTAQKIENALLVHYVDFWSSESPIHRWRDSLFSNACTAGRITSVQRMCDLLKPDSVIDRAFFLGLCSAAQQKHNTTVMCLLASNRIRSAEHLQSAIDCTDSAEIQQVIRIYAAREMILLDRNASGQGASAAASKK